ncbi:MAG TPA: DUF6491 family protein [Marinagarivorans sp.]
MKPTNCRLNARAFAGFLALLVTGCTNTSHQMPAFYNVLAEQTGQNGRSCVDVDDIRGYGVLKHDVISVDGRDGYYLMTVLPGCMSLQTSSRALFDDHFGDICGGGQSRIRTDGNACTIRSVFEFSDRSAAFDTYNTAKDAYSAAKAQR